MAVWRSYLNWSPIGLEFGRNVGSALIHVHTRFECSRSNSNETRQQWCRFEHWPLWPSKVGKIKNPGIMSCILIRYTLDKAAAIGGVSHWQLILFLRYWWEQKVYAGQMDWTDRQTDRWTDEHCVWQNQSKQKKNVWARTAEVIAFARFSQSRLQWPSPLTYWPQQW
jgi:hypothetical protein